MKTVLVTAIGTATSTAIVRVLKDTGCFHIIGADINNQIEIVTSRDVDEYYKFPFSITEDYIRFALGFCEEHRVDYYFASIDAEVVNLSKNREKFAKIGTKLCVVDYEFARLCHYKDQFGKWISEHMPDIAIREYKSLDEIKGASYPLFIKPNEGVASKGCRIISNYDELVASVREEQIGTKILVQDYIKGTNITVDCVRNKATGQIMQIQRKELLRNSNGCGVAVEIFRDNELERICDTLMRELDLNGVANIELFETDFGYKIIEINPRFSAGTLYSCFAGVNTVLNAMRIVDNEMCVFGEIALGAHFAERYEAYRMD